MVFYINSAGGYKSIIYFKNKYCRIYINIEDIQLLSYIQ